MIGEGDIFLGVGILVVVLVVIIIRVGFPKLFGHWAENQVENGIERNSEEDEEDAKINDGDEQSNTKKEE